MCKTYVANINFSKYNSITNKILNIYIVLSYRFRQKIIIENAKLVYFRFINC